MFKFGVSKRDITPEISLVIPGYYEKRFIKGALDPLYVKAVVFEGEETAVSVVADTINLRRVTIDAAEKLEPTEVQHINWEE